MNKGLHNLFSLSYDFMNIFYDFFICVENAFDQEYFLSNTFVSDQWNCYFKTQNFTLFKNDEFWVNMFFYTLQ